MVEHLDEGRGDYHEGCECRLFPPKPNGNGCSKSQTHDLASKELTSLDIMGGMWYNFNGFFLTINMECFKDIEGASQGRALALRISMSKKDRLFEKVEFDTESGNLDCYYSA